MNNTLETLFNNKKPIIGMVHSLPLPGTPRYTKMNIEDIYDYGLQEAYKLKKADVDAILIENAGDIPFIKSEYIGPETSAIIAVLGDRIRKEIALPIGINIVANAAKHSLASAVACKASFVRVNQWANAYIANEGFVEGASGIALRYRSALRAEEIKIFADVHVKHGAHAIVADRSVSDQAIDVEFFDADILIGTGLRTGNPTSPREILEIKKGSELPVLVGSGINEQNLNDLLTIADGAIIGVSIKEPQKMSGVTNAIKIQKFMDAVKKLRESL